MDRYFFCYTKRVSDYLNSKGFKFITVAIDPKSRKIYSLYKVNEELSQALSEYEKYEK